MRKKNFFPYSLSVIPLLLQSKQLRYSSIYIQRYRLEFIHQKLLLCSFDQFSVKNCDLNVPHRLWIPLETEATLLILVFIFSRFDFFSFTEIASSNEKFLTPELFLKKLKALKYAVTYVHNSKLEAQNFKISRDLELMFTPASICLTKLFSLAISSLLNARIPVTFLIPSSKEV